MTEILTYIKRLYFDLMERILFWIEERIYLEEDRRTQLMEKIYELQDELTYISEVLDEYEYAEYLEEMRDSTLRY